MVFDFLMPHNIWVHSNSVYFLYFISVWLWSLKDGGSLKASVLAKNQHTWRNFSLKNPLMNYSLSKNAKIVLSKPIFYVKNQSTFFNKKLSKNINLRDRFLVKLFFSKLSFWTTILSKITLNFWRTDIPHRIFYVDSWPKMLLFRTHHL